MKRRDFLKRCSLPAISMAALNSKVLAGGIQFANNSMGLRIGGKRYNVLFVLADQWRYSAMGHGYHHDKKIQTPHLDKLAKDGAHWQWCYATQPICTPNRAAIITSRYPHQTNMESNNKLLPQEERCIAHEFTDAGYTCHYIGKWHMDGGGVPGYVTPGWRRRGFTTFEGFNRGHGGSKYLNSSTYDNDGNLVNDIVGIYEPTYQTNLAINFIKQNKEHPFFCYLSWGPPHQDNTITGYTPPPEHDIYNASDMILRPNVSGTNNGTSQAKYFGHCTAMDSEFGRLMETLEQEGLTDNTLVVFNADHGDMLFSHGLTYKGKPEEESCHVPLLMRLPDRIKPGKVITNSVNSIDLMPTILSLCGLNVPDTCVGKDKSPLLLGETAPEESIYCEYQDAWRMVVKNQFKLIIRNVDGGESITELFDLNSDPYELLNLLNSPAHTSIQSELESEYAAWKQKTGDVFLG